MSAHVRFRLVAADGPAVALPPGRHTVGSNPESEIRVAGAGVEPVHLVVTVTRDRVFCQVRRPGLALRINDRETNGGVLRAGDRLDLGDSSFVLYGEPPHSESPGSPEDPAVAALAPGSEPEIVRRRAEQSTMERHYAKLRDTGDHGPAARHLELMYRLAQLVGTIHDTRRFAADLLDLVLAEVGLARAYLVRFSGVDAVEVLAARGQGRTDCGGRPSATILGRVRDQGVSLLTTDAAGDPRLRSSESIAVGAIRGALCAPVYQGEELLGAIYADGSVQQVTGPAAEALTLVESIASFTGVALGRSALYAALRQRELHAHLLVHDMKNPLGAVLSGVELLEMLLAGRTDEASAPAAETLRMVRRAAEQLDGYISDILSVAQLEGGALTAVRELVPLGDFLDELRRRWAPAMRFQQHALDARCVPENAAFPLDRRLINRVIDNLLDNAFQHAPTGGVVTCCLVTGEAGLRVTVADGGSGVPPEARELVFEKFGRARARTVGGRGFGLYFCRLAVQAHGGRIWVEGEPGDNRFVFTLPPGAS